MAIDNLVEIPQEVVDLISYSVASDFKVFPIGGKTSSFTEFEHQYGYIELLCFKELTDQERNRFHFLIPRSSFKFITPRHPEFPRYEDAYRNISDNFQQYLEHYYPPEDD